MAGADYEEQSGELVFEMGVTKRQIQIEITDDGTYEKEEQVESSTCCSRLTTHYSLLTTHAVGEDARSLTMAILTHYGYTYYGARRQRGCAPRRSPCLRARRWPRPRRR